MRRTSNRLAGEGQVAGGLADLHDLGLRVLGLSVYLRGE